MQGAGQGTGQGVGQGAVRGSGADVKLRVGGHQYWSYGHFTGLWSWATKRGNLKELEEGL